MLIRATSKWSAVVAVLALAGCSDDSKAPVPDIAAVKDKPGQLLDEEHANERGKVGDAKPGDAKPSPDTNPAVDKAVTPDQSDPSCKGITCTVINDCCECTTTSGTPWTCGATCKVDTCTSVAITQPSTRCLNGHCPLESDKTGCTSDKECKKLDDCCNCGAVPATASAPPCSKMCLQDTCSSWGLSSMVARCLKGVCRLAP